MSGAVIAVVLAAGLVGGGAAYLVWALVLPLLRPGQKSYDDSHTAAASDSSPGALDPSLNAEIAAVRTDMAELARVQLSMLEGMAERESQLLSEMRAVASTRDPELLKSLQRIEALLAGEPEPGSGVVLKDEEDAGTEIETDVEPDVDVDADADAQTEDDDLLDIGRV